MTFAPKNRSLCDWLLICGVMLITLAVTCRAGTATTHPATQLGRPAKEVHFSPDGGCELAIVDEIGTAKVSVHVLAYNFTSAKIADALIQAKHRGVEVRVVVDKSMPAERNSVLEALLKTGVKVRVDHKHQIAHNKVILVDGVDVETGSFNFTSNAEANNAENALILRDVPELVAAYELDFEKHWDHAEDPSKK